jgi:galactokinase
VTEHVTAWFAECYGREPDVAWQAPGRVNLIGEHTDYNAGLVLPFAMSRSVTAAAAGRTDGVLELRSRQAPGERIEVRLDRLAPGIVTGWAAYAAGAAWALGGRGPAGASLVIDSDLPLGAGLASSAALEGAVLGCLADLADLEISRTDLARLAWRAETGFVGVPCGIMDQFAVMLCRPGHALLLDCRSEQTFDVPLDPAASGLRLMVADTAVRHELTGGEYARRRRECEAAARALRVASLRDVPDEAALAGLADPVLVRRARHVVTENGRVAQAVAALRAGALVQVGPLLTESHRSLRDDFDVSWPEANLVVDAALAAGALGARMMGGGFGGCVLALAEASGRAAVEQAAAAAFARHGRAAPAWLEAAPGPGARRINPG